MIKLSMIIPYYDTYVETKKLLEILKPQLTDETEIIIIEDSLDDRVLEFENCIIIRDKINHGLSWARNRGIEKAQGEYLVFIDSDDYVSNDYVESILNKINTTDFDYCYFSWKPINQGWKVIIKDNPPEWNWAVWNAVYKKDYVEMFDENLRAVEDVPWQIAMRKKNGKKAIIDKVLYFYNDGRPNSLSERKNNF